MAHRHTSDLGHERFHPSLERWRQRTRRSVLLDHHNRHPHHPASSVTDAGTIRGGANNTSTRLTKYY
jgi:hypothetical protein